MNRSQSLISASQKLSKQVSEMKFSEPTAYVYNPLDYAWAIHQAYLELAGKSKKKVIFLGMNPGPFGMAQTGVPFGEIPAVRDWMELRGEVSKLTHFSPQLHPITYCGNLSKRNPRLGHPKRPWIHAQKNNFLFGFPSKLQVSLMDCPRIIQRIVNISGGLREFHLTYLLGKFLRCRN